MPSGGFPATSQKHISWLKTFVFFNIKVNICFLDNFCIIFHRISEVSAGEPATTEATKYWKVTIKAACSVSQHERWDRKSHSSASPHLARYSRMSYVSRNEGPRSSQRSSFTKKTCDNLRNSTCINIIDIRHSQLSTKICG